LLELAGLSAFHQCGIGGDIVRVGEGTQRRAQQLGLGVPKHGAQGAIDLHGAFVRANQGHPDRRVLERQAEARFAGCQRARRGILGRDVPDDG
jgi:hypothetical protein